SAFVATPALSEDTGSMAAAGAEYTAGTKEAGWSCLSIAFSSATSFSRWLMRSCIATRLSGVDPDWLYSGDCARSGVAHVQVATKHTIVRSAFSGTFVVHLMKCLRFPYSQERRAS